MKKCCVDTAYRVEEDYRKRVKELEAALKDTLDWYLEYGVILKPQIDIIKQLLQK